MSGYLMLGPKAVEALRVAQARQFAKAEWSMETRREGDSHVMTVSVSMPPLHSGLVRVAAENSVRVSPAPSDRETTE